MNNPLADLRDKSLVLIFAYAPAGLGHLRVTDALYHGLPEDVTPILLGAQDESITLIHRIMSIHVVTRTIMGWFQDGILEEIYTFFYRSYLRSHTKLLYQQTKTILDQRLVVPHTVLIVATHFALAHQFAPIKEKLEKEMHIKIVLAVQVTDDSPQEIWYVPGADITFVPSEHTKRQLLAYGRWAHFPTIPIDVIPYPISTYLDENITKQQMEERASQLMLESDTRIHIAVPVSGAAVGLKFSTEFIDELHSNSHRFFFHVIGKHAGYTQKFFSQMSTREYVEVLASLHSRDVVDFYEKLYRTTIVGLEITKPSEQSFKALCNCEKRGAVIMLFTQPVGRQESDNLDFLRRHYLIPTVADQETLWLHAKQNAPLTEHLKKEAPKWRGVCLPTDAKHAAQFVWWCFQQGLFTEMATCKVEPSEKDTAVHELGSDGVKQFWKKIEEFLMK
ncbi:MAG: hypothetical protein KGJ07_05930 [Patescibacteria group bacterium]|nr:hypothetical protein [Patescibacteria group bacterium]